MPYIYWFPKMCHFWHVSIPNFRWKICNWCVRSGNQEHNFVECMFLIWPPTASRWESCHPGWYKCLSSAAKGWHCVVHTWTAVTNRYCMEWSHLSNYNFICNFSLAAFEFPQINYRAYNGKKYSTLYGSTCSTVHGRDAVSHSSCTSTCMWKI